MFFFGKYGVLVLALAPMEKNLNVTLPTRRPSGRSATARGSTEATASTPLPSFLAHARCTSLPLHVPPPPHNLLWCTEPKEIRKELA